MSEDNIVRPQSPFQEKYLKSNAKILVVGGAAGCLPAETEFLSPSGWVKISEWSGDAVAEVDLSKDDKNFASISFKVPEEYIKLPCEEMSSLDSKRFSMTVSDEHRVVFWNDNREAYQVQQFDEVVRRHEASRTKGWTGKIKTCTSQVDGTVGLDLTESELRLQVLVMADGHFVPEGSNNYCSVSLSKPRKIARFRMLAEKFGWNYRDMGFTESDRYSEGGIHKFIVWPKLRQKRYNGDFWHCTTAQLKIICDEVRYWDSNVVDNENSTTVRYCSKFKEDADFIQYAFTATGTSATIVEDIREGKETYTVNTVGFKFRSFANKDGKCPVRKVKTSDGMKYCFTTSTGFFLVRQDGNIFVTGNSSKSYVGLMRHLRFVHDPNYRGFCIRKNSTAIMKAGGLFEQAKRLYSKVYPPINGVPQIQAKLKEQKLVFPSGATISFSHYENDSAGDLYHGLELSSVFYDEGTHADESHIWWLFSRLRTEADMGRDENGNKIEACMWISCNPDPDSFLFEWVKWWLYPEGHPQHGLPDPEKNGVIRWILRFNGDIVWGDSYEELFERYKRHDLPDDHEDQPTPVSFQCLLGNLN